MSLFKTIQGVAEAEIVEKKSRFIAHVSHVASEEEALAFLASIRAEHTTARHNVYAYILRNGRTRYSDDGEPAQTSGLPTFQVLEHAGLFDVACVTTRYFGGVLLGTGGLVRAYTQAAQAALSVAHIVTIQSVVDIAITVPYSDYDNVVRLVQAKGAHIQGSQYSDVVSISARVLEADAQEVMDSLTETTCARAILSAGEPHEAAF